MMTLALFCPEEHIIDSVVSVNLRNAFSRSEQEM